MHIPVSCDLGIFRPLRRAPCAVFVCRGLSDLRARLRPIQGSSSESTGLLALPHASAKCQMWQAVTTSAVHFQFAYQPLKLAAVGKCSTFDQWTWKSTPSVWEHTCIPLDDFTRPLLTHVSSRPHLWGKLEQLELKQSPCKKNKWRYISWKACWLPRLTRTWAKPPSKSVIASCFPLRSCLRHLRRNDPRPWNLRGQWWEYRKMKS